MKRFYLIRVGVFMTWRSEKIYARHLQVLQIQIHLKTSMLFQKLKPQKSFILIEEQQLHQLYETVKNNRIQKIVDFDSLTAVFQGS